MQCVAQVGEFHEKFYYANNNCKQTDSSVRSVKAWSHLPSVGYNYTNKILDTEQLNWNITILDHFRSYR